VDHELEAEAIIEVFNSFSLDYVVIGAFAAIAAERSSSSHHGHRLLHGV
jgi:hypothetical protein